MEEFDDDLEKSLAASERARMVKLAAGATFIVAMILGAVFWAANNREIFRPNVSEEDAAAANIAESNDPVCRKILEEVATIRGDWEEREARFHEELLGDDAEAVDHLRETATAFRSRLEAISTHVGDAVFRDRRTPTQMRRWFSIQDNEFMLLAELADRQLAQLRGEEVEERDGLWETPEELRDRLLMTIDESFQEFRVWAAAGGHPCGPAPEGVEPWRPAQ